jgi:hypothetical protein
MQNKEFMTTGMANLQTSRKIYLSQKDKEKHTFSPTCNKKIPQKLSPLKYGF